MSRQITVDLNSISMNVYTTHSSDPVLDLHHQRQFKEMLRTSSFEEGIIRLYGIQTMYSQSHRKGDSDSEVELNVL